MKSIKRGIKPAIVAITSLIFIGEITGGQAASANVPTASAFVHVQAFDNSNAQRNFAVDGYPRISGTMRPGNTVEVIGRLAVFSPEPSGWRYQWMRGDDPIPFANRRTYHLTNEDAGHQISVRVTAMRTGFRDRTVRTPVRTVQAARGTFSNPWPAGYQFNKPSWRLRIGETTQSVAGTMTRLRLEVQMRNLNDSDGQWTRQLFGWNWRSAISYVGGTTFVRYSQNSLGWESDLPADSCESMFFRGSTDIPAGQILTCFVYADVPSTDVPNGAWEVRTVNPTATNFFRR